MVDVFISYSRQDREKAGELADFLDDCGYNVWCDPGPAGKTLAVGRGGAAPSNAGALVTIRPQNPAGFEAVAEEMQTPKVIGSKNAGKLIPAFIDSADAPSIRFDIDEDAPAARQRAPAAGKMAVAKSLDLDEDRDSETLWERIKDSRNPADFTRFIEMFPTSSYAGLARFQIRRFASEARQTATRSEDAGVLHEFGEEFPDDPHVREAKAHTEALRQRAAEAEQAPPPPATPRNAPGVTPFAFGAQQASPASRGAGRVTPLEAYLPRLRGAAAETSPVVKPEADGRDETYRPVVAPEAVEDFHAAYPDSAPLVDVRPPVVEVPRTPEVRALPEMRASQETRTLKDPRSWDAIRDTHVPAEVLRFLRENPISAHAGEAARKLADLPRKIEDEAWSEIKDAVEPSLFQAFLAAWPNGRHAQVAQAKLFAGLQAPPPELNVMPVMAVAPAITAAPAMAVASIMAAAPAAQPKGSRRTKIIVGLCVVALLVFALSQAF